MYVWGQEYGSCTQKVRGMGRPMYVHAFGTCESICAYVYFYVSTLYCLLRCTTSIMVRCV